MFASLASIASLVSFVAGKILYAGVNESGGEFGAFGAKGQGLPGEFGVDYAFINEVSPSLVLLQWCLQHLHVRSIGCGQSIRRR